MSKFRSFLQASTRALRQLVRGDLVIFVLVAFLAVLLRLSLRSFQSGDSLYVIGEWYKTIRAEGFAAIGDGVSNYTPLYLYLLYFVSILLPGVWGLTAIKLPCILFDILCAWLVFRAIRLHFPDGPAALFAFIAALFAPTMVLNSAAWGQIDILYATGLIACLYFLLRDKGWLACLAFGVALAFKFQAVFLAPLLLILLVKGKVNWKQLLLIPAVYLVSIVPAWIAGRPLLDLLTIYSSQVGQFDELSMAAPNLYAWIPNEFFDVLYPAGLILGTSMVVVFVAAAWKSRAELSRPVLVQLALASVLILPFFMPRMHERYFFPADVISIVYGFFFPAYFFVPLLVNLVSFFAYQPVLFDTSSLPLALLALVELASLVVVMRKLVLTLFPRPDRGSSGP